MFRNLQNINIVSTSGTHTLINAPILFDFRQQIIQFPYDVDFITIPPKNYTIQTLPVAIKTAFAALSNPIVMTTDGIDSTFYDADGRMKFITDVKIIIKTNFLNEGYNPMAYVIGLRENEQFIQTTHHCDTTPDLSGISAFYIRSSAITRDMNCLCGNDTSTSTIAVIPITVDYNIYDFWSAEYDGKYMRLYQMPLNLSQLDIQITDVQGNVLSINSDVSLLFEIVHES